MQTQSWSADRRQSTPNSTVELEYSRPWVYPKQLNAIFEPKDHRGLPARFSIIEASTKTGKTEGCGLWLNEQALSCTREGANFWWIAPSHAQARVAFRRAKRAIPRELYSSTESPMEIRLHHNGVTLAYKSGEKPDLLFGDDVYGAVIDEASRLRPEAWFAVVSLLTATAGNCRIIGNVKGKGTWFYKKARLAQDGDDSWSYHKMTAWDAHEAGILKREVIEQAMRDLPRHVFNELYLAEPADEDTNPFGGVDMIKKCVRPVSTLPPVVWGWDLAKSMDWTVGIGLDRNGHVCRFARWQRWPWKATIAKIKQLTGKTKAYVDSTGVGDAILEQLQEGLGSNFEGFKFTFQSKQQLMERLASAIQQETVGFPYDAAHPGATGNVIVNELAAFEYEHTRLGARYTAPEGLHDDTVCSLALAVACLGDNPIFKTVNTWRGVVGKKH